MRNTPPVSLADPVPIALAAKDESLRTLYASHWAELCNYLKKRFGSGPPVPEDLAQQAFARFASRKDSGEIDNARAYLYRVAHNIAVDEHRRAASVQRATQSYVVLRGDAVNELTPDRVLMANERLDVLRAAIARMPPARRRSLLLNRLHGLSCAEIARRTGYSETAVKKHVALAMKDLEAALTHAERSLRNSHTGGVRG